MGKGIQPVIERAAGGVLAGRAGPGRGPRHPPCTIAMGHTTRQVGAGKTHRLLMLGKEGLHCQSTRNIKIKGLQIILRQRERATTSLHNVEAR